MMIDHDDDRSDEVCPEAIASALAVIRPRGAIMLCTINPAADGGAPRVRTFIMPDDLEAAAQWAFERNAEVLNLYFLVNSTMLSDKKPAKGDMVAAGMLWADCDPQVFKFGSYANAREHLETQLVPRVAPIASFVIDSGNGISPFFVLRDQMVLDGDYAEYERINKRLGDALDGGGAFNCDRIMRLPGTWNYPNKAKLTKGYPSQPSIARMLQVSKRTYTLQEVDALVSVLQQDELRMRFDRHIAGHPAVLARWQGKRDDLADKSGSAMDFSMVSMLKLGGFTLDECRILLADWPHGSSSGARATDRYWARCWDRTAPEKHQQADVSALMQSYAPGLTSMAAPAIVRAPTADDFSRTEDEDISDSLQAAQDNDGREPMPNHLLTIPGALGDAVDWINATSRKPQPHFAVQAALAVGSAIMGRRYRTNNANWPALYFLNAAITGGGKEYAKTAAEALLEEAGLGQLVGASRFASESGVLSSLIEKPAHLAVFDEFGKALASAAVQNNFAERNMLKALMEIWGRCDGVMRPVGYSTAGLSSKQAEDLQKRLVRKPSLTLMAMSTPETLFQALTSDSVIDGFLNRILIAFSDTGRQLSRRIDDVPIPGSLTDWMQHTHSQPGAAGNMPAMAVPHDMDPTPVAMRFTPEAARRFDELEARVHARMGSLDKEGLADLYIRTTEQAMRVSMIVAASMGSYTSISADEAQWAIDYVWALSQRTEATLRAHISDSVFDALLKQVATVVAASGERGLTENEINRMSRKWRAEESPQRRAAALETLTRRKQIVQLTMPSQSGRGRVRVAYVSPKWHPSYEGEAKGDKGDKAETAASPLKA